MYLLLSVGALGRHAIYVREAIGVAINCVLLPYRSPRGCIPSRGSMSWFCGFKTQKAFVLLAAAFFTPRHFCLGRISYRH